MLAYIEGNGICLHQKGKDLFYLYLNGTQVPQGEKAFHYTDFQVEPVGDILNIHITEEEASDYSGQTLKHERLYRIDKDKEYEAIQLFKNGQEVSFDGISG